MNLPKRYYRLFGLSSPLYRIGAPVIVSAGTLFVDKIKETVYAELEITSISGKTISAVNGVMHLYDYRENDGIEDVPFTLSELSLNRGERIGVGNRVEIPSAEARSFSAEISEVCFADGSVWKNNGSWRPIKAQQTLTEALGDESLAAQYAARYGSDCRFMPTEDSEFWYCACGAVNKRSDEKCFTCRRNYSALKAVNLKSLKAEADSLRETEKKIEEEEKTAAEEKKSAIIEKLKKRFYIIPIAAVLILVIATVPAYMKNRNAYADAAELLEAGEYTAAKEAFAALGSYADADEQAEKNVSYVMASRLLECAENADKDGLDILGVKRSEISAEIPSDIYMYRQAAVIFRELEGYKDSEALAEKAEKAVKDFTEQENSSDYAAAAALLEEGKYVKARDAFLALDDFKDSAEMAVESLYCRNKALLDFVQNNNVRRIYARISDEQGVSSLFSMPNAVMVELGSDAVYNLKLCCLGDGVEFEYEDAPSEGLLPICEAISECFTSLGDYKDSADLAKAALGAGEFTKEFYGYLKEGKLQEALDWLNTYDDEIENRDKYPEALKKYMTFASKWTLYMGDSTLIPVTAGSDAKCGEFTSKICIEGDKAIFRIIPAEGDYTLDLTAELGSTDFVFTPDNYTFYYVAINQVDHLAVMKYAENGKMIGSCEYARG